MGLEGVNWAFQHLPQTGDGWMELWNSFAGSLTWAGTFSELVRISFISPPP